MVPPTPPSPPTPPTPPTPLTPPKPPTPPTPLTPSPVTQVGLVPSNYLQELSQFLTQVSQGLRSQSVSLPVCQSVNLTVCFSIVNLSVIYFSQSAIIRLLVSLSQSVNILISQTISHSGNLSVSLSIISCQSVRQSIFQCLLSVLRLFCLSFCQLG